MNGAPASLEKDKLRTKVGGLSHEMAIVIRSLLLNRGKQKFKTTGPSNEALGNLNTTRLHRQRGGWEKGGGPKSLQKHSYGRLLASAIPIVQKKRKKNEKGKIKEKPKTL